MRRLVSAFLAYVLANLLAGPAPSLAQKDYSQGCKASGCHDGLAGRRHVHAPVESDSCDDCHEPEGKTQDHRFKLARQGAELCTDCHDAFEGKTIHSPVASGDCTDCHDPHASDHAGLLKDTQAKVCGECHEDVTEDRRFLHGPVAAGACTGCHNPHASDHEKLLTAPGAQSCLACHDAMQERLAGAQRIHAPVQQGCIDCHDPHGANNQAFTKQTSPGLCFECHDDVQESVADAKVGHSAVTGSAGCGACHDAHTAAQPSLLRGPQRDICLACHTQSVEVAGRTIPGFENTLTEMAVHHGPIDQGECAVCHKQVHGGDRAALLAGAYPDRLYAPYDSGQYELCFECHDADAFADAETEDATEFRNGTQNLHHLHVARQVKGRSCRACHSIHASHQPHLIAESVPFGTWRLPIGYQPTSDGGTCASGCHRPYRYDRKSAVTNIAPAVPTPADS